MPHNMVFLQNFTGTWSYHIDMRAILAINETNALKLFLLQWMGRFLWIYTIPSFPKGTQL